MDAGRHPRPDQFQRFKSGCEHAGIDIGENQDVALDEWEMSPCTSVASDGAAAQRS